MATILAVLVFFSVCGVIGAFQQRWRDEDLRLLARIDEEFRMLAVDSEFPELCFDGSTAEIVDERQEGLSDDEANLGLVRVHRFARNAHGEYFLFISEGAGKPFFKHVTQANAKLALGSKYVAPAPAHLH